MKKLSRKQQKIIGIAIAVIAFIFLFWFFVYVPQSRQLSSKKSKLKEVESQIAQINQIIQGRDLTIVVADLNQQLKKATDKLPFRQEVVINYLSENARNLKIEVKNINLSEKNVQESQIAGYKIEELPVTMNLSCDFRSLGEYLNILRDNQFLLTRVRQLDIEGSGEGKARLNIGLQISIYLAKEITGN